MRAYEGVNGVNLRFVAQSFRQLLDQILPLASSPIDVLFPSFGIYGIVFANYLQLSSSIFWTDSQRRSLSLAQ
jgi:hypothetical protein